MFISLVTDRKLKVKGGLLHHKDLPRKCLRKKGDGNTSTVTIQQIAVITELVKIFFIYLLLICRIVARAYIPWGVSYSTFTHTATV